MSRPNVEETSRPSILLLIVDCLRADRAFAQARLAPDGYFGRLCERGFSFTNAVTVAPTTTPAVATMVTGLYPFEQGRQPVEEFVILRAGNDAG